MLSFTNNDQLEVFQDGCNEIRQEFHFSLQGDFQHQADSVWFNLATEKMTFLARLSPQQAALGMWGRAIQQLKPYMTIGQSIEPEPNTFILVDRLVQDQSAQLIIRLESKGNQSSDEIK